MSNEANENNNSKNYELSPLVKRRKLNATFNLEDELVYQKIIKTNANKHSNLSIMIEQETQTFDLYKGIIYMFFSCLFRTFFSFLCKVSLNYNHELTSFHQISMFNYFYFFVTIISFYFTNVNIFSEKFFKRNKFGLIILRNILAISSLILIIYTLKVMHISDVFSVFFMYPAIVIIISVLFLNEKSWWFDYVCCIASFLGAVLIVRPDFLFHDKKTESNYYFYFLVLVAALLKALEDCTTRFIGKAMHFQAINLFYTSIGMIAFPLLAFYSNVPLPILSKFEVFLFFITGLCAWSYQTLATLAFQNEKASRVSMVSYLQVDFMYIIDILVFSKPLLFSDMVGTLLIFSFNFANGLYKTLKRVDALKKRKDIASSLETNVLNTSLYNSI